MLRHTFLTLHNSIFRTFRSMSSSTAAPRTYAAAIDALNSLQSNAATLSAIRETGNKQGEVQTEHSLEYLKRIGYDVSPFLPLSATPVISSRR